jgi:hypothetical protein
MEQSGFYNLAEVITHHPRNDLTTSSAGLLFRMPALGFSPSVHANKDFARSAGGDDDPSDAG